MVICKQLHKIKKIQISVSTGFCAIKLWVECSKSHPHILKTVEGDGISMKREVPKTKTEISTVEFFSKKP